MLIFSLATPSSSKTREKAVTKAVQVVAESESEEEEDADEESGDVEDENEDEGGPAEEDVEEASSESDDEGDPSKLVHESLQKGAPPKGQSRHGKSKFIPSEETPEQRDARTVFVGNVAVEVAKSRVRPPSHNAHTTQD